MAIKKILVTGSSGTIGTRLCEKLLEDGYDVIGADYRKNIWNEQVQNITIDVDLRDSEQIKTKLPRDIDIIIHLAANARVYNLVVTPSLARDNFEALFNVLEFARTSNIKRFIFASSREVYGNSEKIIHSENEAQIRHCESPYTASKLGGEALVHAYQQCYNLRIAILRFSNVYGMYDTSDRVIPLFINNCRAGKDLIIYGKEKLLDFTYIDDTVAGICQCIKQDESINDTVLNIAYGEGTSLTEVAQLIQEGLQANNKLSIEETRTGEVIKYIADITKAKKILGYTPQVDIKKGIQKTIAWYNTYYSSTKA